MGQYKVRLSDWLNITDKEFDSRNSAIEFAVNMLRDIGSAHGLGEPSKIEIGIRKGKIILTYCSRINRALSLQRLTS